MEGRPLDTDLVFRAQQGDLGAYEELVRQYQDVAFRAAYIIVGDEGEAEEAAQTAFIKAYQALPSVKPDAPFRPWLLAIVGNEARNRRASAGRRARLALRLTQCQRSVGAAPSAERAALVGERERLLLAAVERLPELDRVVIQARYFLDLSEREAAAALGCRPGTVKSRLSRALSRLRLLIEADGYAWREGDE